MKKMILIVLSFCWVVGLFAQGIEVPADPEGLVWWQALLYALGASLAANGMLDTGIIKWGGRSDHKTQ